MIHSLCENYGWSYNEALSITMPQMILLSHASSVACERTKAKSNKKKKPLTASMITVNNKTLDQLNSEELAAYYLNNNIEGGFGDVTII